MGKRVLDVCFCFLQKIKPKKILCECPRRLVELSNFANKMFAKKINKCLFSLNPKSHRLTPNLNVVYQRFYSEQIKKEEPKPLENSPSAEPIVTKPIETPIETPIESKSTPIEEPVPKKEEVVVAQPEPIITKKEEAILIDSQVDKEFESDKEQAAKLQTRRNNFIFIGLGVALGLFSLGLYYYAMALSEEVIQKLWVPEQDFSSLTDDQILIRIENFGEKLDFPTLRAVIYEQEWPIMMCIQCLKHKEPLIRESALHVLTKMSDYDEFRAIIGKRVNFSAVMNEALKRPGLTKDDFPYHTFLAQFMDQQNVQKLTLSNNGRYFFALINMLNSQEIFPRGVAIVALSKLAANNDANKLMASYGVFPTILNYFNPYDPAMTLHNDGTYFKFRVRESAYKLLEQLYRGQNKDIALRDYDEPIARSMGRTLEDFERSVSGPFMYSEHIFKTMIGGAAIGFVWGFIRHLIKNRNLKTAFTRGATKASLGTFLFVFAAQLARLASDKIPNPSDSTQAVAGSIRMVACYSSFFVSKRYFPFCFFPAFLTLVSSEWPYPPSLWNYRETSYPTVDPEEYHRQIEEQQIRRQLQDAKRS